MDIAGSAPIPPTLTLANVSATAAWQVGQRLDAVVTAISGPNRVSLQIGTANLDARTSLAAAVGQKLQLEVVRNDNQIILRIVPPPLETDPLAAALRATLPKQLPLQTVLSRFVENLASSSGLSLTAADLLKRLLLKIPPLQTITRMDALKQALMDSGPFLEHKLSSNAQPPSLDQDLKANLLRLLAALNQNGGDAAATDLSRNAEAALARIQLHQLSMLAEERTSPPAWTGELPVRHGDRVDVLQFRIEKDARNATAAEQQSWSTWLTFNLPALGPLYAKITLTNKNISATLWAELSATAEIVNQHLDCLHQSLDEAGLAVKGLLCLQGRPPSPPPDRAFQGLLDLTA